MFHVLGPKTTYHEAENYNLIPSINILDRTKCLYQQSEKCYSGIKEGTASRKPIPMPLDSKDGKTYAATGSCTVCKMDLKLISKYTAMTCSVHEDGNCSCDDENCACENCAEHS